MGKKEGNCYAATEALYHILGGKSSGWKVMRISSNDLGKFKDVWKNSHWFLQHAETGIILDASVLQFKGKKPPYHKAKHSAFYPVKAGISKSAMNVVDLLTYKK